MSSSQALQYLSQRFPKIALVSVVFLLVGIAFFFRTHQGTQTKAIKAKTLNRDTSTAAPSKKSKFSLARHSGTSKATRKIAISQQNRVSGTEGSISQEERIRRRREWSLQYYKQRYPGEELPIIQGIPVPPWKPRPDGSVPPEILEKIGERLYNYLCKVRR